MHVLYLLESIPKGDFRLPRTNVYYTLWEFEIARFVEVFEIEIFVSLKNTSVCGSLISASHDTQRQPRNVKKRKKHLPLFSRVYIIFYCTLIISFENTLNNKLSTKKKKKTHTHTYSQNNKLRFTCSKNTI